MKTCFIILLLSLYCTAVIAQKQCNKVTYSAHSDYPPYHWYENGQLTGASIEITNEIFKELGISANASYEGPWKRVLKKARSGDIDMISALKVTPERKRFLIFTEQAFYKNPIAIFVKANTFERPIKDLNDLDGLIGSISLGDRHGKLIDNFVQENNQILQIAGLERNFKVLQMGRSDYFIYGYYPGLAWLHQQENPERFAIARIFSDSTIHHAFSKQSPCKHLAPLISKKLEEYTQNSRIDKVMSYYQHLWLNRNR